MSEEQSKKKRRLATVGMDPEELGRTLLNDNKSADDAEAGTEDFAVLERTSDLVALLRNEARTIGKQYKNSTEGAERRRYQERYEMLDRWLGELKAAEAIEDPGDAEAAWSVVRVAALEEMRKWRGPGDVHRSHLRAIETGRKQLVENAKAGAGAATQKRIKDEIDYLLKNYTENNEAKIETLMDKWRRSGDPNYDPSIKLRLRKARKKKASDDYAF